MEPPGAAEEAPEQVEALKLELVTAVCSALVPGANLERPQDGLRLRLAELCRRLAPAEPEFLLQSLAPDPGVLAPLPRALRDALVSRFAAFDLHQLGKYRGRPGKRRRGPTRRRQQPPARPPARRLRGILQAAAKKLTPRVEPGPSLPPSLFSLRSLVRRLHVREPREHVRALLGRR
ncbi:telomerase protein component 1-like [Apteryx rowi]|uniref:telomerase protein component 1-like n=1 Tax=Apteryx rowi TaxID=308060 RepID=UPI000E1D2789|nr:telomerase protein component 1-like [Apteryx rowi]